MAEDSKPSVETVADTEPKTPTQIPDRLFFRIGDVADVTGVEAYVLRYWETEFPALKPKKTSNGQRQYRRKDVELVLEIKRLLYDEGYTIAGARKAMRGARKKKREAPTKKRVQSSLFGDSAPSGETLKTVKKELREILSLLK